jgi:hypothetical protein
MRQCEYFLVEYVPSALQNSRAPIGVLLLDETGKLVRQGLTRDWRPLRCLDSSADPALLEALPTYFDELAGEGAAKRGTGGEDLRKRLLAMADNDRGTVQISQPRGVKTDDPAREFDRLFAEHVERRRPGRPGPAGPRAGSRRWIQARLREALERHALWDRFRKSVSVEEFTAAGDSFRIDLSYRPNGVTKYLHALSLERDWNQAKVLSYTFWRIRQRLPAVLTAIVADAEPKQPAAQSCRRILAESEIAIQPLAGLDGFLAGVEKEMQLR